MNVQETILNTLALFSRIFRGFDEDLCREMISEPFRTELTELKLLLGRSAKIHVTPIIEYLAAASSPSEVFQDLETHYIRLFINSPGGVKAPLYQSFYSSESGLLMGRPAQRMSERLNAAGFDPADLNGDPPDHISAEIDYLFLALEAAFTENIPEVKRSAQRFAQEELLPFTQAIHDRLTDDHECPFFPNAAGLLVDLLKYVVTSCNHRETETNL